MAYGVWMEVLTNFDKTEQVQLQNLSKSFYNVVISRVQTLLSSSEPLYFEVGKGYGHARYEFNRNLKTHKPLDLGEEAGYAMAQVGKDIYTYSHNDKLGGNHEEKKGILKHISNLD